MTAHTAPAPLSTTTDTPRLIAAIRDFFSASAAGVRAYWEYQRLSRYGDAELARIGLRRDEVPAHAFNRAFGD